MLSARVIAAESSLAPAVHGRTLSADRIIVGHAKASTGAAWRQKISAAIGTAVISSQAIAPGIDVIELEARLSGAALNDAIRRLEADASVTYASADLRRRPHALTNDPLLGDQWYLLGTQAAATRTEQAWDITRGDSTIVVAVLDTGVRFEHPDLERLANGGNLLSGYDFVSRVTVANDGDGRDPDSSDPGDWISAEDIALAEFSECDAADSSWHGTRVAGLVAARTDNATGIAGAAWNTRVMPVRVMGKCGGFDSDIIAAMRWAAGLTVAGVSANPTPASIINLSLGGDGECTAAYQAAVDEITARGVLLVASAGNDGGPVNAPANCGGVLAVAGLRHVGTKVGFSNLGPAVGIAAPAGNCVNTGSGQPCLFSIVVPSDAGRTQPSAPIFTDAFNYNVGTSFSAPQVASAAALMRAVNGGLAPAQLILLLKNSATAFPIAEDDIPACHVPADDEDLQRSQCSCTPQTCGAGMLDTAAAVASAQRPFAVVQATGTPSRGATISIDGSMSFAANGRQIVAFQWTVASQSATPPVIIAPTQATTTLQIAGDAPFTLRLTATDDTGASDTATVDMTPTSPPALPSDGGGGHFGWEILALALLLRPGSRQRSRAGAVKIVHRNCERLLRTR